MAFGGGPYGGNTMTAISLVNWVLKYKLRMSTVTSIESGTSRLGLEVLAAINEIQRRLIDARDWDFLKNTGEIILTSGVDTYTLDADPLVRRLIHNGADNTTFYYQQDNGSGTDVAQIEVVSDAKFLSHKAVDTTEGKPYIARLFGRANAAYGEAASNYPKVQFYHVPDTTTAGTSIYYDYIEDLADLEKNIESSPFDWLWLAEGAAMVVRANQGRLKQFDIESYVFQVVSGALRHSPINHTLPYRDI